MKKSASILDYSYPFLDPAVWDHERKLFAYQKDFILRLISTMYETYSLQQPETWVEDIVIIGSLTTSKWLFTSDLDVHIRVNLDAFIASNMPGSTKEQAFEKLDLTRKEFDRAKILAPMTQHPIEFYFESIEFKPSNTALVGIYSLAQDAWVKEPITFDADLDFEESRKDVVAQAEALAEELDGSLGKIRRDIKRIDELEAVIKAWDQDKQQLFYAKVESKLKAIEAEIMKDLQLKQELVDARHANQDATSEVEIKFKWLARFGFFGILSNLKTLMEQTGGQVTTQELPLIEKIISQGSVKEASDMSYAYWVDPAGKIYTVRPNEYSKDLFTHSDWVVANQELLKEQYGLTLDLNCFKIIKEMYTSGWARIGDSGRSDIGYSICVWDLGSISNGVDNALAQFYKGGELMVEGESDHRTVIVGDPFPNLQQAVNKALQKKRMGSLKEAFLKEAFEEEPKELETDVCVDFDKTIAHEAKYPAIGEPIEGAKESLAKLQDLGYNVIIYSCRGDSDEGIELITKWLDEHDMPYDSIFSGDKPFFKYVIDDKAIHFDSWDKVMQKVEKSNKTASSNVLRVEPYGGGPEFPVLVNPSRQQVARALPQTGFGQLRVIQANNNYIWDAEKATHDHVMEYLAEQGLEEYDHCQTGYITDASDIDEFSWQKAASLHVTARIANKYWIAPDGKEFAFSPSDSNIGGHLGWIPKNKDILKGYGIDLNIHGPYGHHAIADDMIKAGWTRVTTESDYDFAMEVADINNLPPYLDNFVAKNYYGGGVEIDDLEGNYQDISDPFPNLRKAIYQAKRLRQQPIAASLKIEADYEHAYWIDPNGKTFQVRGEGVTGVDIDEGKADTHFKWVQKNREMLIKDYGFKPVTNQWTSDRLTSNDLMAAGWIRIGDSSGGSEWGVTLKSLSHVPTSVDSLLAQFVPEGAQITIEEDTRWENHVAIIWPVKSVQQAVNQALQQKRLQPVSKAFSKKEITAQTKKVKQGDYSCLMALVPHDLAQEIVAWGVRNVPDEELYLDEDGNLGRELESHITIKYGLLTNNAKHVRRSFNDAKPFHAKLGKVRHFQPPELPFDVLTVEIISDDLQEANEKVCDKFECAKGLVSDEYKPHITIAYMKRDTAKEYVGADEFEGKEVELDTVIFSPHKGNRTYFSLSQDKESSFILQEINKVAYPAGNWAESAWISPTGEVEEFEGDSHVDMIFDLLDDDRKYDSEDVLSLAINKGWTRFGEMGGGGETGANVQSLRNINPAVFNHALKYTGQGKEMVVSDLSGAYVKMPVDEFVLGQGAVNKALMGATKTAAQVPFSGEAWRGMSMGGFPPGTTAADVIRYEAEELGNDNKVDPNILPLLEKRPASDLIWVTKSKEDATKYGNPQPVKIDPNSTVIGQDEEGGYLILKSAEFLPSMAENAPTNRWQFAQGGDDVEIALQPDSVSDDATEAEPCTTGKPRTKDMWRQFMSIFQNAFSKKENVTIKSYDKELEQEEKDALGEDQTLLEYSKGFYDPAKHDFPHNTTWDSLTQDGEPSKPTSVTYSPQISNDDNLDQNSPGGFPRRFMGKPKGEWFSNEGEVNHTLIDMLKNRQASLDSMTRDITAGYGPGYWIDPNGKAYQVRGEDDLVTHYDWINRNKELLLNEYGIEIDTPNADFNSKALIKKGWTRVGDSSFGYISIETPDLTHLPAGPLDSILSTINNGKGIIVEDMNGGHVEINWIDEVYNGNIQKAVNKALQRKRLGKQASIEEVNGIKVLVNPSPEEVKGFVKKFRSLRALVDPQSGDIFVWNAYQSEHNTMIRYYGLDIDWENDDGTYIRHVTIPNDINYLFDTQAEIKNRKGTMKQAGSNNVSYWIDPKGEVYLVPETTHDIWMVNENQLLKDKYGIDTTKEDWRNLIERGWTRVNASKDSVSLEVADIHNVPSFIKNFIKEYIGETPKVFIEDRMNNSVTIPFFRGSIPKSAGDQSASVPDYLIDEWKTDQLHDDISEEPYVNHDQRDYPYGMHDSPENTGYNIGWAKDNQPAVVRLDTLENPAYRLDPFGIGEYNVTWYTSLPASDGIEKTNPE